ncbi:hypothetical protein [Rhodoferax sp.]|uniref:hypothetical protein n=1 Tax=Rhodoferax sp. TaxID=50421 RepID=UPI001A01DBB4|nr:hypothetical protein [Rhodoferax sp.]MBE0473318.1 hypothetical protein [Rhodoferax sp.]
MRCGEAELFQQASHFQALAALEVPAKVSTFIAWLQGEFGDAWWRGSVTPGSA